MLTMPRSALLVVLLALALSAGCEARIHLELDSRESSKHETGDVPAPPEDR